MTKFYHQVFKRCQVNSLTYVKWSRKESVAWFCPQNVTLEKFPTPSDVSVSLQNPQLFKALKTKQDLTRYTVGTILMNWTFLLFCTGYRESAFAYAIAAAGVTHQVSMACSLGKLKSCGCDMSMQGQIHDKFEWGGCSHNVEFGEDFAHKFMDAKENAGDIHAKINLHNNKVGRLAVMKNVQRQCKCHGMSGSCEIKTCWKATPDFRIVGDVLKRKYHKATELRGAQPRSLEGTLTDRYVPHTIFFFSFKVNFLNTADNRSRRRLVRKQKNTMLLYYEKSPNFCDPNPEVDSPGTTGRFCNKTSDVVDNCETLCCGRGYNTLRVKRTERCHCKFHWCCYVVCQTCTYNEWVTVCK
ncbi:hypothetical protein ACJMK2_013941 [Sinanodonta woodiana]|uniref:Protein Wnt n=1 Tax=Sinanodonta woodiana TaxID=1069815 RepID=A0ABD3V249_SINWO